MFNANISGYSSAKVTWNRTETYQKNAGLKNSTGVLRLEHISKIKVERIAALPIVKILQTQHLLNQKWFPTFLFHQLLQKKV